MSNGAIKKIICDSKVASISGGEVAMWAQAGVYAQLSGELTTGESGKLVALDEDYLSDRARLDRRYCDAVAEVLS